MNKRGFTLLELLAVIVAISIITLLVVPNILNMVNNKRDDISNTAKQLIYDATDLYIKENVTSYPATKDSVYCIKIETLVNSGKISSPVRDIKTDKDIPLNYYVKTTIDNYDQYQYQLVNNKSCVPTITYYVTDANVDAAQKTISIKYPESGYVKKYKILSGTTKDNLPLNTDMIVSGNPSIVFTSNGSIKFWVEDGDEVLSEKTVTINKITN